MYENNEIIRIFYMKRRCTDCAYLVESDDGEWWCDWFDKPCIKVDIDYCDDNTVMD